jgi:hypothetical protein
VNADTVERKLAFVVYRVTFPNGKIHIGKDIGRGGHSLRYFGSWDNLTVEADFSTEQLRDFSLRKEILFESHDADAVTKMESELIIKYRSNDPKIGYNRTHRRRRPRNSSENIEHTSVDDTAP